MSTTASAPGKVLITGGYRILERPNVGIVVALDSRFHATVSCSTSRQHAGHERIVVHCPQLEPNERKRAYLIDVAAGDDCSGVTLSEINLLADHEKPLKPNKFIEYALLYTIAACRQLMCDISFAKSFMFGVEITLVGDEAFYSSSGKTGLGSSAALVSSLVAALLAHCGLVTITNRSWYQWCNVTEHLSTKPISSERLNLQLIHNLAQFCHSAAQGGVGSGFDVSAAVFGSQTYVRFQQPHIWRYAMPSGEKRPIALPNDIVSCVCPTAIRQQRFMAFAWVVLAGLVTAMLSVTWTPFVSLPAPIIAAIIILVYCSITISSLSRILPDAPTALKWCVFACFRLICQEWQNWESCNSLCYIWPITTKVWAWIGASLLSIAGLGSAWIAVGWLWPVLTKLPASTVQKWALPDGLTLMLGILGNGSSTVPMARRVMEWRDRNEKLWDSLGVVYDDVYFAIEDYNGDDKHIKTAFRRVRHTLTDIGIGAGVDIVPSEIESICTATEQVSGVAGVSVPGAGGYDAIFAIVRDDATRIDVERLWSSVGMSLVNVNACESGIEIH